MLGAQRSTGERRSGLGCQSQRLHSPPGLPTPSGAALDFCYHAGVPNYFCAWTAEYNVVQPMDPFSE